MRYVNEAFLLFQSMNQIEKFKNNLNFQYANIKFNYEIEKNNSLPFFDIKIISENKKFTTRLKTHDSVFTSFDIFWQVFFFLFFFIS